MTDQDWDELYEELEKLGLEKNEELYEVFQEKILFFSSSESEDEFNCENELKHLYKDGKSIVADLAT